VSDIRITVNGLDELRRAFGDIDDLLDDGLRPGIEKSAVIVEGAWKDKVHKVTRKYAGSIGNEIEGQGASIEAHIGPQPGLGQPRGYTKSSTGHWKKPRNGRNTGDPQVYAVYEDQGTRYRPGHPAAEPAVRENEGRIEATIAREFDRAVQRRFR
jgi:HK97 gp10 family phage protein